MMDRKLLKNTLDMSVQKWELGEGSTGIIWVEENYKYGKIKEECGGNKIWKTVQ